MIIIKSYSKIWLTESEINNLFSNPNISSRDLILMKFCYYGLLRMSEALNAKKMDFISDGKYVGIEPKLIDEFKLHSDVHFIKGLPFVYKKYYYFILRKQKTDKKNWEKQPIPAKIYGEIIRYCKDNKITDDEYIFQSNRNKKLSYPMAYLIVKKCAKLANVNKDITTHTFRRSRGTHLSDAGMNVYVLQKLLRHKDLRTTLIYLKISKDRLYEEMEKYTDLI